MGTIVPNSLREQRLRDRLSSKWLSWEWQSDIWTEISRDKMLGWLLFEGVNRTWCGNPVFTDVR